MPHTKEYFFRPEDLYALLVHYTDGGCPLNGEVTDFLVHPQMVRKLGLLVMSDEWDRPDPLFLGYDGKRTMSWTKGQEDVGWAERNETPTRQ